MSNAVGRAIAALAIHGPSGLAKELQGEVEALKAHVAALETENSLLREKCLAAHCRAEAFAGEFDRRVRAEARVAALEAEKAEMVRVVHAIVKAAGGSVRIDPHDIARQTAGDALERTACQNGDILFQAVAKRSESA